MGIGALDTFIPLWSVLNGLKKKMPFVVVLFFNFAIFIILIKASDIIQSLIINIISYY